MMRLIGLEYDLAITMCGSAKLLGFGRAYDSVDGEDHQTATYGRRRKR